MKKLFFPLIMLAMMCACTNPKDAAKQQLVSACENADKNSANFSDEEWVKFLYDYHEADSLINVHKSEYTAEEMDEIKAVKRNSAALLLQAKAIETKVKLQKLGEDVKEGLNGLLK